jgi:nitrate reductase assembly molybdenum cofactor insertion protein NarJ
MSRPLAMWSRRPAWSNDAVRGWLRELAAELDRNEAEHKALVRALRAALATAKEAGG